MLIKKTDRYIRVFCQGTSVVSSDVLVALREYGFSEKEMLVYIACIRLGPATANKISDASELNRSTTYDVLKSLLEKGVASKFTEHNSTHFEVVRPDKLILKLEAIKIKLKEISEEINVLSMGVQEKPVVELYQGQSGVKTVLDLVLEETHQLDIISTSKVFKVLIYTFPKFIINRKNKKIHARVIQEASDATNQLKKRDKDEFRETRSIQGFDVNSMTFVSNDKVAIIKLMQDELFGTVIRDKSIAQDNKRIFNILWAAAEKNPALK